VSDCRIYTGVLYPVVKCGVVIIAVVCWEPYGISITSYLYARMVRTNSKIFKLCASICTIKSSKETVNRKIVRDKDDDLRVPKRKLVKHYGDKNGFFTTAFAQTHFKLISVYIYIYIHLHVHTQLKFHARFGTI
jgi:1,4-dihydroxy-2-naphthoate octaprenyltransferase